MSTLYNRKESENEIVITLKYQAACYILLLAGFVLAYAGPYTGMSESTAITIVILGVAVPLIVYTLAIIGINREVRKAMKSGNVQVSGSKFSFSNPLTYRIKK